MLAEQLPQPQVSLNQSKPKQFFFERTAQDSACFIDIEEKNTRLRLWEAIARQQKRKEKKQRTRLDWGINTGTTQTAGRTGTSTRPH
jgi:hypothetical protein